MEHDKIMYRETRLREGATTEILNCVNPVVLAKSGYFKVPVMILDEEDCQRRSSCIDEFCERLGSSVSLKSISEESMLHINLLLSNKGGFCLSSCGYELSLCLLCSLARAAAIPKNRQRYVSLDALIIITMEHKSVASDIPVYMWPLLHLAITIQERLHEVRLVESVNKAEPVVVAFEYVKEYCSVTSNVRVMLQSG